jgi:osmoprotectant transport system permease protein
VQVVATATLGPLVGYRDLGTPIITGFQTPNKGPLLAGAIAVILLALLTDGAYALIGRWLVPWRARTTGRVDDAIVSAPELAPDLVPSTT